MLSADFIYLDGREEREQLIQQVVQVRDELLALAEQVPEDQHYTPRYGQHSLAVMLAHLQLFDTSALWFLKAASNGFRWQPSPRLLRSMNTLLTRMTRRRLVRVSAKGIRDKQADIVAFIRDVPIDSLSADVLHPGSRKPYTLEKAVQIYFVHYWRFYLAQMQQIDGVTGPR